MIMGALLSENRVNRYISNILHATLNGTLLIEQAAYSYCLPYTPLPAIWFYIPQYTLFVRNFTKFRFRIVMALRATTNENGGGGDKWGTPPAAHY